MTQADHRYFVIRKANRTYLFDWIIIIWSMTWYKRYECILYRANVKDNVILHCRAPEHFRMKNLKFADARISLTLWIWNTIGTCTFSLICDLQNEGNEIWEFFGCKHHDGGYSVLSHFIEIVFFFLFYLPLLSLNSTWRFFRYITCCIYICHMRWTKQSKMKEWEKNCLHFSEKFTILLLKVR